MSSPRANAHEVSDSMSAFSRHFGALSSASSASIFRVSSGIIGRGQHRCGTDPASRRSCAPSTDCRRLRVIRASCQQVGADIRCCWPAPQIESYSQQIENVESFCQQTRTSDSIYFVFTGRAAAGRRCDPSLYSSMSTAVPGYTVPAVLFR